MDCLTEHALLIVLGIG